MKSYKLIVTHSCDRCKKTKDVTYKDPASLNMGHNTLPKGWIEKDEKTHCKACCDGLAAIVKEYMGIEK